MRRATRGGDLTCPHAKQASECLYSAYFLRVPTIFGKEDCDRPKRTPGGLGGADGYRMQHFSGRSQRKGRASLRREQAENQAKSRPGRICNEGAKFLFQSSTSCSQRRATSSCERGGTSARTQAKRRFIANTIAPANGRGDGSSKCLSIQSRLPSKVRKNRNRLTKVM